MTILVCSRKQFDVRVLNKSHVIGISLNSPEETPWSGFGLDVSYVQMANNKWHMWARDKKKPALDKDILTLIEFSSNGKQSLN